MDKQALIKLCDEFNTSAPERNDAQHDELFSQIIDSALVSGVFRTAAELGNAVSASHPTIERWRTNRSTPHMNIMKGVVTFIRERALC